MNMEAWNACGFKTLRLDAFEGDSGVGSRSISRRSSTSPRTSSVFRRERSTARRTTTPSAGSICRRARASDPDRQHYQGWMHEGLLTVTDGNVIDYGVISTTSSRTGGGSKSPRSLRSVERHEVHAGYRRRKASRSSNSRRRRQRFSEPMKELEALVIAKRFHHDGNPILTWMMSNVTVKPDAKDNIFPRKDRAESKIDGAVALHHGTARARDVSGDETDGDRYERSAREVPARETGIPASRQRAEGEAEPWALAAGTSPTFATSARPVAPRDEDDYAREGRRRTEFVRADGAAQLADAHVPGGAAGRREAEPGPMDRATRTR
jgi:phage terminase large subunit-like protein